MNLLILITMLIGCGIENKKKALIIPTQEKEEIKEEEEEEEEEELDSKNSQSINPEDIVTQTKDEAKSQTVNESTKLITEFINSDADIDQTNEEGMTQLMLAARAGDIEGVKLLIKAGADVNKKHENEMTALIFATIDENIEVINELIATQVDLDSLSCSIFISLRIQNFEITKVLIKAMKAILEVNELDKEELEELLAIAIENKADIEIVKMINELIKSNKEEDDNRHTAEWSPQFYAIIKNQIEILKTLLKDKPFSNGLESDLFFAITIKSMEAIKELIKAGADINYADEEGRTPLMEAVSKYNVEIINELISAGAILRNINFNKIKKISEEHSEEDNELLKQFITAVKNKDTALMYKLRSKRNKNKTLIWAVQNYQLEACKELIAAGANVNMADEEGRTPLMHAAEYIINMDIIKALIAAGANVNMADQKGQTVLMYAMNAKSDNIDIINELIAAGANVNMADEEGRTPLMYGSIIYRIDLIKILIKAGADPNVTDNNGNTALSLANENNNIEGVILEELLKKCFI